MKAGKATTIEVSLGGATEGEAKELINLFGQMLEWRRQDYLRSFRDELSIMQSEEGRELLEQFAARRGLMREKMVVTEDTARLADMENESKTAASLFSKLPALRRQQILQMLRDAVAYNERIVNDSATALAALSRLSLEVLQPAAYYACAVAYTENIPFELNPFRFRRQDRLLERLSPVLERLSASGLKKVLEHITNLNRELPQRAVSEATTEA